MVIGVLAAGLAEAAVTAGAGLAKAGVVGAAGALTATTGVASAVAKGVDDAMEISGAPAPFRIATSAVASLADDVHGVSKDALSNSLSLGGGSSSGGFSLASSGGLSDAWGDFKASVAELRADGPSIQPVALAEPAVGYEFTDVSHADAFEGHRVASAENWFKQTTVGLTAA